MDTAASTAKHPACPCCGGSGDVHGDAHLGYGMTAPSSTNCSPCRGLGRIAKCWDCDAPFASGDELYENRLGEFVCGRCSRGPQRHRPGFKMAVDGDGRIVGFREASEENERERDTIVPTAADTIPCPPIDWSEFEVDGGRHAAE
jgi:hypothetical protein